MNSYYVNGLKVKSKKPFYKQNVNPTYSNKPQRSGGGIRLYENLIFTFKRMGLKVQNMKYNAALRQIACRHGNVREGWFARIS